MDKQYVLGVDIGTSLIKAVVFDLEGQSVGVGTATAVLDSPQPGWFQQDMDVVWAKTAVSIQTAIAAANINPAQIAVVSPAGQGDGAWMIDAAGKPICPAPLWNDGRAANIVNRWKQDGTLSKFFQKSGATLWPGAQAAILSWLRENEPTQFARIRTVFCCKDWIKFKLTNTISTDETDGSTPFMGMTTRQYDDEQMALLHLNEVKAMLPPVKPSHAIVGRVTKVAAAETGLAVGTPVASGLLDVAANAVGLGTIHSGQAFTLLGTTALNAIVRDKPIFEPLDVGATICHGLDKRWLRVLGTMAGTPNLDWYLANMGEWFVIEAAKQGGNADTSSMYTLLEAAVAAAPVGAGGVLFHPYLQGERAPFFNATARAGFFGIGADTQRHHLARAVYEGVAFAIRDCFESIGGGVSEVMLGGGGANSPVWCQILADITGCTMVIPAGSQFGTLGAALVGAVGVGLFRDVETAVSRWVKTGKTYTPNPANHRQYNDLYALYRSLQTSMTPFWADRQRFLDKWN